MSPRPVGAAGGRIEQPDRVIEHVRAQVHVPLRRHQVLVSGQELDGAHRRAPHRQVRAERVTESVRPMRRHVRDARHLGQEVGHVAFAERQTVLSLQHLVRLSRASLRGLEWSHRVLSRLVSVHGTPQVLRSDDGHRVLSRATLR